MNHRPLTTRLRNELAPQLYIKRRPYSSATRPLTRIRLPLSTLPGPRQLVQGPTTTKISSPQTHLFFVLLRDVITKLYQNNPKQPNSTHNHIFFARFAPHHKFAFARNLWYNMVVKDERPQEIIIRRNNTYDVYV